MLWRNLINKLLGEPRRVQSPLDVRVAALAASWQVALPVAWHLVQVYATQRLISMEAAMHTLHGLSYDEAREQAGEG